MILSLDQKEFEMIRATAKYFIDLQDWKATKRYLTALARNQLSCFLFDVTSRGNTNLGKSLFLFLLPLLEFFLFMLLKKIFVFYLHNQWLFTQNNLDRIDGPRVLSIIKLCSP